MTIFPSSSIYPHPYVESFIAANPSEYALQSTIVLSPKFATSTIPGASAYTFVAPISKNAISAIVKKFFLIPKSPFY